MSFSACLHSTRNKWELKFVHLFSSSYIIGGAVKFSFIIVCFLSEFFLMGTIPVPLGFLSISYVFFFLMAKLFWFVFFEFSFDLKGNSLSQNVT